MSAPKLCAWNTAWNPTTSLGRGGQGEQCAAISSLSWACWWAVCVAVVTPWLIWKLHSWRNCISFMLWMRPHTKHRLVQYNVGFVLVCFFFSRNCSRCHLRCIHVQLVWLSSGFLLYYTCHFLYIHIYVWFRASDAEVHSCVASLRKSIKYYLMHVNFIFNTISKVNCRKHITIHHGIINWYRMCGEKAISQNH